MEKLRQQTLDTYNNSAKALSEYFQGIGSRVEDIELGLKLAVANDGSARVVEIGCGDGRDAAEIIKHTSFFEGVDYSKELINLAKRNVPGANFIVQDMLEYKLPKDLDVIFAFASLLHLDKDEITKICKKASRALKPGGIFYISLKYRPNYESDVKTDQHGDRLFFYYNPLVIKKLAGAQFKSVHEDIHSHGKTEWFNIALQKL
jgi:SAM-dependent methyltransferase